MERKLSSTSLVSIGNADPVDEATKAVVLRDWNTLMTHEPLIFQKAWVGSANRSASIKQIFGIPLDQDAGDNHSFSSLYTLVEDFFTKVIITEQMDEEVAVRSAQALGERHIDFVGKGFKVAFWDIFMSCLRDILRKSLKTFGNLMNEEMETAFEKAFTWVVYNMRLGFYERKRREYEMQQAAEELIRHQEVENVEKKEDVIEEKKSMTRERQCRCS